MEDFELTLFDRLNVIKDVIAKYGEDNFYISFSGGKDSTLIHYLVDKAIPNNRIPRVFFNTGIEYNSIVDFVKGMASKDDRFILLSSNKPIKKVLDDYGYPFKSKEHSLKVYEWQKGYRPKSVVKYSQGGDFGCPKELLYQFNEGVDLKISNKCCYKLKKDNAHHYEKQSGKHIAILGLRQSEGGQRKNHASCITLDSGGKISKFKPLNPVSDDFEKWEIENLERERGYHILCELYYPPYSFDRTGCKGCPYAIELADQLEKMARYFPNERKQCEAIWKPVYDEYRRIGYRLKKNEQIKLFDI